LIHYALTEDFTMPRRPPSHRRSQVESFDASVSLGGHEFTFRLHTRPLALGREVSVQYYWMDSTGFRITRSRRAADPVNFRNCVGHWWAAMQAAQLDRDEDQIRHLIMATSFGLISGGKAMQQVFRDAHLAEGATAPEEQSLPEEVQKHVRAVVDSRDRQRVRQELDEILRAEVPDDDDLLTLSQTFDGLLKKGVEWVRSRGNDGLEEFLALFDAWSTKHRKKGGRDGLRRFLNLFAYQCKISFYLTYANAWISLIPWLQQHRGLDDVSERFLRMWHMQNQPIEQSNGIVLPDVFCGQVLSLHPLSGFFMKDPALCAAVGPFFTSPRYAEALAGGLPEYWEMVGAILTAARLYRQAADRQANLRGLRSRGGAAVEGVAAAEGAEALRDFAESQKIACPFCNKPAHFVRCFPAGDADQFRMEYTCRRCNLPVEAVFERDTLERWLEHRD
jgi:hypothetical protein